MDWTPRSCIIRIVECNPRLKENNHGRSCFGTARGHRGRARDREKDLAIIVDGLVLGVVFWVLSMLFGSRSVEGTAVSASLGTLGTLGFLLITFGYYALLEGYVGQTLGKMLLGIKVVRESGGDVPPGFVPAAIRTILRVIDVLPFRVPGGLHKRYCLRPRTSGSETWPPIPWSCASSAAKERPAGRGTSCAPAFLLPVAVEGELDQAIQEIFVGRPLAVQSLA